MQRLPARWNSIAKVRDQGLYEARSLTHSADLCAPTAYVYINIEKTYKICMLERLTEQSTVDSVCLVLLTIANVQIWFLPKAQYALDYYHYSAQSTTRSMDMSKSEAELGKVGCI